MKNAEPVKPDLDCFADGYRSEYLVLGPCVRVTSVMGD